MEGFAEKQNTSNESYPTLRESTIYVPRLFESLLIETLDRVARLTEPLRITLKRQTETGRLLPQFQPDALVPMLHLYPYLSGNPFWAKLDKAERDEWKDLCRKDESGESFDLVFRSQCDSFDGGFCGVSDGAYMYFTRLREDGLKDGTLKVRRSDGSPYGEKERLRWNSSYLRVSDIENHFRSSKQTKTTDLEPLRLEKGYINTWELLFLHPKRSLAEERNDGICDIKRYASVSRPSPAFLSCSLGEIGQADSLFERYGQTEHDRKLVLRSHMLRHLMNNELFRLGVADTILSKQFNRRSVVQSYEYDHRTLAEDLDPVEIPEEVEFSLGEKTATVYRMIKANRASGPIVDDFRRIQQEEGEEAALTFLRAEADGFHATPYGTCVSSFTVSPCPKHLQCFDGCRHLASTADPNARSNLKKLEIKLMSAIDDIQSRKLTGIGSKNQLDHAQRLLQGVRTTLASSPGSIVFPDGTDYSLGSSQGDAL